LMEVEADLWVDGTKAEAEEKRSAAAVAIFIFNVRSWDYENQLARGEGVNERDDADDSPGQREPRQPFLRSSIRFYTRQRFEILPMIRKVDACALSYDVVVVTSVKCIRGLHEISYDFSGSMTYSTRA
jgi:hypothetical protein